MNSDAFQRTSCKRSTFAIGLLSLVLTAGCVSSDPVVNPVSDGGPKFSSVSDYFVLTAEQADRVMQRAIRDAWATNDYGTPLPEPRLGYEFNVWFKGDTPDKMVLEAIPQDGGYVFRVGHSRSAPFGGVSARERLLELVSKYARDFERMGKRPTSAR